MIYHLEYKEWYLLLKMLHLGAPGWLSHLNVWLLILAQVIISGLCDQAPGGIQAEYRACLGCSFSLPLCPSPLSKTTTTKSYVYQEGEEVRSAMLWLQYY